MPPIHIQIDLGPNLKTARRHARNHPDQSLRAFAENFHARFPKDRPPSPDQWELPLSRFRFVYVTIEDGEEAPAGPPPRETPFRLRDALDRLWEEAEAGDDCRIDPEEPESYSEALSDTDAVRIAYAPEMKAVADFLRNGLSVLVVCDKILTEHIHEWVCGRSGKKAVLDTEPPPAPAPAAGSLGARLDAARSAEAVNPVENLPRLIRELDAEREIIVIRSLNLFNQEALYEILYQRTANREKPQFLAFVDPSLEIGKVLKDRFAVHVGLTGLPRYVPRADEGAEGVVHTVAALVTRAERARFCRFQPEGLYKNVAGLNAVQFRNAMRYVGARLAPGAEPVEVYRLIRQFKTSSSAEIEIPDTTFEDIGGYVSVKEELRRAISLIAGAVGGMDDRRRAGLTPRGFIFHGPPGTGKTLFAKAIANEMNATIQMVSGPEVMDKYVGQSESNIRHLFAVARRNAPAVIFFDEFDSLVSKRSTYSDGGARANNAVVAQFLTELDGFRQGQTVLVIGTTNRIDIIDEALLRPSRLKAIEIGLPDYAARRQVAGIHAASFGVDELVAGLCDRAAKHLNGGAPGGEVPEAFREALLADHEPFRRRWEAEENQAAFLRDVARFAGFVADCRREEETGGAPLLERLRDNLAGIARRHGLDPELLARPGAEIRTAMESDLAELLTVLRRDAAGRGTVAGGEMVPALLDLVAEYTEEFNNDEIRAVFQEASLEYHMNGQLITPRYIGQKIGLIRKRRDERRTRHLTPDG